MRSKGEDKGLKMNELTISSFGGFRESDAFHRYGTQTLFLWRDTLLGMGN